MRLITYLSALLFTLSINAQDYKTLWSETVQDELSGKTESAYQKVQNIYTLAKSQNNEEQILKCFFYISKFRQVFEEKAQENIITNLKEEIATASPISKSILNYIYGSILVEYYNFNTYKIDNITPIDNNLSNDLLTWSTIDFKKEIAKSFTTALQEEVDLSNTSIDKFSEILEIPDFVNSKQISLLDLLTKEITEKYFNLFNNYTINQKFPNTEEEIEVFYSSSNNFINLNFKNYDHLLASFLEILQQRETYYLLKNETDNIRFERLLAVNRVFNQSLLLESSLTALENTTKNQSLKYELILRRAKNLNSSNLKKDALTILDEIIKANPNEYITTEAILQKENILDKQLNVKLKKISYLNENTRAFIESRNIDSLKVSYYQINTNEYLNLIGYKNTKNDKTLQFLEGKKPIVEITKSLPNPKNHNQFTTEILLDKLSLGNYIVVFEDTDKLSNTEITKNYSFHTVSNITYIEDENTTKDLFYLLDRKTGQPLTEACIKNKHKTIKANHLGKIEYPKLNNIKKRKPIASYFTQAKDTLIFTYHQSIKYNDYDEDEENFEAKPALYLDRAIYRPGQKVFLKGIIVQDKNNKKSVVPKLTVHVTVENTSNETVAEFDLQTNEFGSFSSEFDLPKTGLTGEFSIEIEEPDNELFKNDKKYYTKKDKIHTFWDNVNLDSETFHFKVEEYKRPTFEITFDKIKEAYSIGDTLQLKGFAKTLAGSNLTNATVTYSISRNYYGRKHQYKNDTNYIQKEITTNENGEFIIPITTQIDGIKNEELNENSIKIEVSITDTNGETQTVTKQLVVQKETLKINSRINAFVFLENENKLNIEIANLDDNAIPTKGKIEIFKINNQNYLKYRQFGFPDIQNISDEEFKRLFPYEPYSNENTFEPTLLKTLNFNTSVSNEVLLQNLKKGRYRVISTIIDTKNNSIKSENHFEVKSKENPLTENQVFAYRQIDKENENEIHFELSTILPQLYITTRYYNGKILIEEKITELINGKGMVVFKKLQNPKFDYSFHFSTQWENDGYSQEIILSKETVSRKINFEVLSFRNKIEPGSQQKWSFKIIDNQLETEVLASMYDSSLDAFSKENWKKPHFYNYTNVNYPRVSENNFDEINFYTRTKKVYYQKISFKPQFQWFGFSFTNPKNNYIKKQYEQNAAQNQVIRKGSKLVTGIVSDSSGPLPGVNVVIKGTQIGSSTNFDGTYSIYVKEGEAVVFSFMGMREITKVVGPSNTMNTVLQDDSKTLGEVVVTAVGFKRADNILNPNIIIVTSNDKDLKYFNNYRKLIYEELENEGYLKAQNSVTSSTKYIVESVEIRGATTLEKNKKALIIIDGEIQEALAINNIPQEDITSITILKGAEGSALYGSDGVNGVIIIATKKGLKELTQVKTRTNFNETAFFYPHLTTNNKGEISFNFTTPESLTRWKLRLLGHDKNVDMGTFESEIISQKDLMIMPNMPRFLRETDTITLSAKVVNLTKEVKNGTAILQLFDAQTGNPIDAICYNASNTRDFSCKAKDNSIMSWQIFIPEGIQGIQYKIIAKSGNFSDGEENLLPVLSNRILITESIPIWVREHTKKEFVFENLKSNTSSTIKNQSFTFEYTSNPTWLAIQSLPYLMEYEHECAEQTFARFYANSIALNIINSQPKVAEVFKKWENEPSKKSKFEMNEELKSIILRETPWFQDADETEKNKRLAYLFDIQKLTQSSTSALNKLKEKQNFSGGFSWFEGSNENIYITQHILSGLGHLQKMFPTTNLYTITDKGIPFIDSNFVSTTEEQQKKKLFITEKEIQYLYCRSFYAKTYPINESLQKTINYQIQQVKNNWLHYGLGQKAMLAISAYRFGDSIFSKKIITHLKETAVKNSEHGMYWIENKNGWKWFESPIENQALLIEAFSEIEGNKQLIDNLKAWLIKNKQRENWGTTKATTEAIYALLSKGDNWIDTQNVSTFEIGNATLLNEKLAPKKTETGTGYFKLQWKSEEINKELATISVENKSDVPSFGGAYWQYFENIENIRKSKNESLEISKEVFKKVKDENGNKLISLKNNELNVGDKLTIRLVLKIKNDLEFVHLKDLRASCLEPVDVISKYKSTGDLWYYMSTKDTATHFFFDEIKQGTFVLEYDVIINNSGNFNNGIATLQSMYAPEFSAHSISTKIKVN